MFQAPRTVPWFQMLTSLPVWAHILSYLGYYWYTVTITSELPTYLTQMLHFNLKEVSYAYQDS